jgi:hypothetical protein
MVQTQTKPQFAHHGQKLHVAGDLHFVTSEELVRLLHYSGEVIGVVELWRGWQGSSDKPAGRRFRLLKEGNLVETPPEGVPVNAKWADPAGRLVPAGGKLPVGWDYRDWYFVLGHVPLTKYQRLFQWITTEQDSVFYNFPPARRRKDGEVRQVYAAFEEFAHTGLHCRGSGADLRICYDAR